jgi:MtfA peptidase
LTAEWRVLLERDLGAWSELDHDERRTVEHLTAAIVATKHWEAARGFEVTEPMRVLIAAQAAILLLGLDLSWLDRVHTFIVHPSAQTQRGERRVGGTSVRTDAPRRIHGRTGPGAPVVLAWDAARREARRPERGRSVVHHELAHQFDGRTGTLDGTPPLPPDLVDRWVTVCTAEFDAVRAGAPSALRAYAGETPAEFFAVATETFIGQPCELAEQHPELYDLLRTFFRQDPAERRRRAEHGADGERAAGPERADGGPG